MPDRLPAAFDREIRQKHQAFSAEASHHDQGEEFQPAGKPHFPVADLQTQGPFFVRLFPGQISGLVGRRFLDEASPRLTDSRIGLASYF